MCEIWKDVIDYAGIYQVSDQGRVRSIDRVVLYKTGMQREVKGVVLKQMLNPNQYLYNTLYKGNGGKTLAVHRLVCEAFIGPCPEGKEVLHGPEGKQDNSIGNLSYGTRSKNELDKRRDGTSKIKAVIRSDGVVFDSMTQAEKATGIKRGTVSNVCRGHFKSAGGYTWEPVN